MPPNQLQAPPRRAGGPHAAKPPLPPVRPTPPAATAAVTATLPDPVIVQAGRDLAAGQVDTDMRATAGLDADQRARLVPGPGGKPPGRGA